MNSEITNVSQLVPLTVPSNKQNAPKIPSIATEQESKPVDVSKEGVKGQTVEPKADAGELSLASVKAAAAKGNSILQEANRNLEFHVDDSTKKVVVKVIDSKSGDVLQQIPSEDMLAFIKRMQELDGKQGAMLQDKA
ncbi:MAG: flagellar protein FlaG [Methylobacter sp.]